MSRMFRSLALLLAVLTLLAPAYAAGAERAMEVGDAECGCCCAGDPAGEAPAELPSIEVPACGCSVPPSAPPTAPLGASLSANGSALSELSADAAPLVALLPLPVPVPQRAQADVELVPDTCCRVRLGVWLL